MNFTACQVVQVLLLVLHSYCLVCVKAYSLADMFLTFVCCCRFRDNIVLDFPDLVQFLLYLFCISTHLIDLWEEEEETNRKRRERED